MVFPVVMPAGALAQALQCGTVIDSYKGVAVRYNNKAGFVGCAGYGHDPVDGVIYGLQYQCVEYVRRFYQAPDKLDPSYQTASRKWQRLNAIDFYSEYASLGLARFKNRESQVPPQPDDIIVFDRVPDNDYGHVAVVRNVTEDRVEIVEQNFAPGDGGKLLLFQDSVSNNYEVGDHVSIHGVRYPVLAWLRPSPSAQFVSLVQGNPGIPGDGVITSLAGGTSVTWADNDFELLQPFSLSGVTDGLTVTVFPSGSFAATQSIGVQANFSPAGVWATQQCNFGLSFNGGPAPAFNGIRGFAVSYSQQMLNQTLAAVQPFCRVTLDQLVIRSLIVFDDSGFIVTEIDALAIGIGVNAFPVP